MRALLSAENVSLRYDMRVSRRTSLARLARGQRAADDFWALRDINLRVYEGECLAIVGANGAGKSTLMRILAGIMWPTSGRVVRYGRVSALLSVQAGLSNELTGRENIRLVGALSGMDPKIWRAREEEIVDFAEIGSFIDMPLDKYSTGMRARLAFSAATAIDPGVLLLDEVLGTGDESFRVKSRARIKQLVDASKAVVFVTHGLGAVTDMATRAVLIEKGWLIHSGQPKEIVDVYRARVAAASAARNQRA